MKKNNYSTTFLLFILGVFISCSDLKDNEQHEQNLNDKIQNAVITEFKGLFFVAKNSGIPAIYFYDHLSGKSKPFWTLQDEKVISLLIAPDYRSGYFITKRKQRLKSSQPAIEKGKLYRINIDEKKVEFITHLEDGIQIIPYWIDNDRFALVINSIDKTIASYINKNTQVYNRFGKLLSDNTEVFDITKDGYPITRFPELKFNSDNGLFSVIEKNDSIQVRVNKSKGIIKTRFTKKEILKIAWAENNRHLIMLLEENKQSNKEKSDLKRTLVIFDLKAKKTVKSFVSTAAKYFVLIGDFLIFENGFERDSLIEIFNLNQLSNFKTIKINGGCGLRYIS